MKEDIIQLARKVSRLSKVYVYPELDKDKASVLEWIKNADPVQAKWLLKRMLKKLEFVRSTYS